MSPPEAARERDAILLVDDCFPLRRVLARIVAEMGRTAVEADNGAEALALLEQRGAEHFALIVADLMLPEMGGAEFLTRARQTYGDRLPKLVVCSSRSDREAIRSVAKLGVDGYILKPFDVEAMAAKLGELI